MATDPHLSDAQIAAIREWRAKGAARELLGNAYISAVRHIEALLDHSEALRSDLLQASVELRDAKIFLHGAEQAHQQNAERLAQAEAALSVTEDEISTRLETIALAAIELGDWRERAETAEATVTAHAERIAHLETALKALRIDANRLCDRQLGGSYERDCRASIAKADAVLNSSSPSPAPPERTV